MCRANLGLRVERSSALGVVLAQSRHEVFILGGALDGVHRDVLPYGGHGAGQCDPSRIGRVCAEFDEAIGGLRGCAVVLAMGDVGVVVEIGWSMSQVASRVQESAPWIGRTGAPRSGFSRPKETPGGRIPELAGMWFFTGGYDEVPPGPVGWLGSLVVGAARAASKIARMRGWLICT